MPSLYSRLFTYRERRDRSPLEDFLTEGLADLLNRFPEPLARSVVSFLLSNNAEAIANVGKRWRCGASVIWTTQKIIDGGRILDLLLEIDGMPIMVVENKIGAGFQHHQPDPEQADGSGVQHQLATYGHWLARETDAEWGGALVLLTHWTPAPADFARGAEVFGCRYRSTIRWAELSRWLKRSSESAEHGESDWARLSAEMNSFLKEQKMDSELATGQDLAALRIYVASADRVRNSVESIWEGAKSFWRPICQNAAVPIEVSTAYGCVWKYRYLARSDLRSSYLAVGIRYPDIGSYSSDFSTDGGPYFFVEIGSDDDGSAVNDLALPDGWLVRDDMRMATLPLRELSSHAELQVAEAEKWVRSRLGEVVSALT
ncbi:PD-(D/E)XK nuclease family protein [Sphingomonas radiodurans]|uniref:PD-(D/E)XK nuclease family protein n=1 Tax=Sphingomonas radiodurans TaxID=2890321 RepID=UPI001E5286CB|nr:PD-(D/E)XK nuclease family protein [Sphingomonas radiodurans]WBH15325.1 PD-(D/E)XK nuclease family protein [Sphingomonas radiodurans]